MQNFTAKTVMLLRKKTGLGLMECKRALISARNFEDAIKILKEKGLLFAVKKNERSTLKGIIYIYQKKNTSVMIEVSCETDFVAKNASFKFLAQELAKQIIFYKFPMNKVIQSCDVKNKEFLIYKTNKINSAISFFGENIVLKRFVVVNNYDICGQYIHIGNRIGVLSFFRISDKKIFLNKKLIVFVKDIAMHIAACNPLFIFKKCMSKELIQNQN